MGGWMSGSRNDNGLPTSAVWISLQSGDRVIARDRKIVSSVLILLRCFSDHPITGSPDHPIFLQCYNRPVLKFSLCTTFLLGALVWAQSPQQTPTQPPVRVNILNVCMPSPEEQSVIKSTMDRVPAKPAFITDFEMTRG